MRPIPSSSTAHAADGFPPGDHLGRPGPAAAGGSGAPPGGSGFSPGGGGGGGFGPPPGGSGFSPGGGGFGPPPGGGGGGFSPGGGGGGGFPPPPGGGFRAAPRGFPAGPKTDFVALLSLALGLLSLCCCCLQWMDLPIALIACAAGGASLYRIKNDPEKYQGSGYAIGGIALGALGAIMAVAMAIFGLSHEDALGTDDALGVDDHREPGDVVEETGPPRVVQNAAAIRTISVDVPPFKPDGRDWDIGGGAPDIAVRVEQDGYVVFQSPMQRNRYEATFRPRTDALVDRSESFTVVVVDRDAAAHDPIDTLTIRPTNSLNIEQEGRNGTYLAIELERVEDPAARSSARARAFQIDPGRTYAAPDFDPDAEIPPGPVLGQTIVRDDVAETLGEIADEYTIEGFHFDLTEWDQPVIVRDRDGARFSFVIDNTVLTFRSEGEGAAEYYYSDGGDDCEPPLSMHGETLCGYTPDALR